MKRATNGDLYFQRQMGDPEMKGLIEEELKALRIGAELAKIRQPRSEPDSRNDGELFGALGYEVSVKFQPRRTPVRALRAAKA